MAAGLRKGWERSFREGVEVETEMGRLLDGVGKGDVVMGGKGDVDKEEAA